MKKVLSSTWFILSAQSAFSNIEYEINENRTHLGHQIGLDIENITGQEALFRERKTFLQGFNKIIKDPKWNDLYPKTQKEAQEYFDFYVKTLQEFLLEQKNFKHKTAELSLRLLQEDKTVPTYYGSSPQNYRSVTRMDDASKSTGLQLFVMLTQMCERKKEQIQDQMTWNLFQEKFRDKGLWNDFKTEAFDIFQKEGVHLLGNIADTINKGGEEDSFINILKQNMGLKTLKGVHSQLCKKQGDFFKEAYSSVIEILFMLQRGHNEKLNDSQEANKPRCPVGFFDDCMREITIASGYSEFAKDLQIQKCEGV